MARGRKWWPRARMRASRCSGGPSSAAWLPTHPSLHHCHPLQPSSYSPPQATPTPSTHPHRPHTHPIHIQVFVERLGASQLNASSSVLFRCGGVGGTGGTGGGGGGGGSAPSPQPTNRNNQPTDPSSLTTNVGLARTGLSTCPSNRPTNQPTHQPPTPQFPQHRHRPGAHGAAHL
jgi:hypothetical protein